MNDAARIQNLITTDPLAEAEKLTGQSYKDSSLGMGMHINHNQNKREALESAGDTHHSSSFSDQIMAFLELGFETVLVEAFDGVSYDGEVRKETLMLFWHPDGVLGSCESHMGTNRNSAAIHYNMKFREDAMENYFRVTSSGRFVNLEERIWSGDHDAREAIKHHFNALKAVGEFLPIWVDQPYLKIMTYQDYKDKVEGESWTEEKVRTDKIKHDRLAKLPEHVRTAIGFEI